MENKVIKEEEEEKEGEKLYKLLDLIPNDKKKWVMKSEEEGCGVCRNHHFHSNEEKLELRLGLPGVEEEEEDGKGKKREGYNGNCCSRVMKLCNIDKNNKNFPSSSHKRPSYGAVVGWPPVRSSRRNLASTSSAKPIPPLPPPAPHVEKPTEMSHKGLFVKINMEGVPIGRKVDLTTYNNYDKLCYVVDTLFRDLLGAQTSSSGIQIGQEREKPIVGLLNGSGEYTLVYEDNEGDRMLVGDVPWNMFVSNVKRLRVLKSSQLPSLRKVGDKEVKQLKAE